ncbi:MAG: urea transporter [Turneriella sp.]|nr:urea transporter [Turneriella sp.]
MRVESLLRSYSNILFSDRKLIGLIALGATFFNFKAGLFGIFAIMTANLLARLVGVHEDKIRKGLIGFNALLLGLSFSYYYALSATALFILFVAVVLLIFVNIALDHIFGYFFNIPALSIPFVLVSSISYLAFYNYDAAALQKAEAFPYDVYFPEIPRYALYYLKSLGAIFFQSSPWAGLTIMLALIISSRLGFLLSLAGFAAGAAFHLILKGDLNDMTGGLVAFNYILTAIALGGIFLVPGPAAFALAILATLATATVASFIKIFFVSFNMPVLTLPFALTTLLFLYCIKLLYNKNLRPVDFLPGSPEYNLDFFKSRQGRFGDLGLDIRLPFWGKWKVSQGYHGEYTHQGEWYASLDFMALSEEGALRKNQSASVEDYFTFGLPVLAVAAGTVRRVVSHLDDNELGAMNLRENWGNLVLIQHGPALFSLVCHLKKNSVAVKEGDYVIAGTKLAQAGNSGRSAEPHLHLHFQATPEIGSATVPVALTQYILHNGVSKIHFNGVPKAGEVVANLAPDFNLKTFFTLAPGQVMRVALETPEKKQLMEEWEVKIDFLGTRFIENREGDRLLYSASHDWFAALDYTGSRQSALFLLFNAYYRVPFSAARFAYGENISYKYFVSLPVRLIKDILLPFTDRVALRWSAVPQSYAAAPLVSTITNGTRVVLATSAELKGGFPGKITAERNGAKWVLSAA